MAFLGIFLALFDTFTTRYNDSGMKLKFSSYFYPYKHFIWKSFLKMNQKCPSDLCAISGFGLKPLSGLLQSWNRFKAVFSYTIKLSSRIFLVVSFYLFFSWITKKIRMHLKSLNYLCTFKLSNLRYINQIFFGEVGR